MWGSREAPVSLSRNRVHAPTFLLQVISTSLAVGLILGFAFVRVAARAQTRGRWGVCPSELSPHPSKGDTLNCRESVWPPDSHPNDDKVPLTWTNVLGMRSRQKQGHGNATNLCGFVPGSTVGKLGNSILSGSRALAFELALHPEHRWLSGPCAAGAAARAVQRRSCGSRRS